jgi:hypothetical protein
MVHGKWEMIKKCLLIDWLMDIALWSWAHCDESQRGKWASAFTEEGHCWVPLGDMLLMDEDAGLLCSVDCRPSVPATQMVTQSDAQILITPPPSNSFSRDLQQAIAVAHGLTNCTAVIVCLQGKLGVINGWGSITVWYWSEQFNFLPNWRGKHKELT